MGVSQLLYMYITNLAFMAFNIIIMKYQNMLEMNNIKTCKLSKELEIVTKIIRANLYAPNQGSPPNKLPLKVMHPKIVTV